MAKTAPRMANKNPEKTACRAVIKAEMPKMTESTETTRRFGKPSQQHIKKQQQPCLFTTPNHTRCAKKTLRASLKIAFTIIAPKGTLSSVMNQMKWITAMTSVVMIPIQSWRILHCWKHTSCSFNVVNFHGCNTCLHTMSLCGFIAYPAYSRAVLSQAFTSSKSRNKNEQKQESLPHSALYIAMVAVCSYWADREGRRKTR